ncbi:hypothetical protein, partial [Enterobacter hormaechei]|uniref:hypothetical protein n=1 Tax=Enterobacter hormaechei TaxID=158836 RepID=UPI003D6F7994
ENSLSAKVSCWLIRLLILGSGYNTMISHLGLIRTFPNAVLLFGTKFKLGWRTAKACGQTHLNH